MDLIFTKLDGEIFARTQNEFCDKLKYLLTTEAAKTYQGIVYRWFTSKPIKRLRGESPVLYIGKTLSSLCGRYYRYAALISSGDNWLRYNYIMNNYGPIEIEVAKCDSPKETEQQLIRKYFEEHLELPPVNKVR